MITVDVSKSDGTVLDYLSAKANLQSGGIERVRLGKSGAIDLVLGSDWSPTEYDEQLNKLLADEAIIGISNKKGAVAYQGSHCSTANDYATAVLRVYVTSLLGNEVDIPDSFNQAYQWSLKRSREEKSTLEEILLQEKLDTEQKLEFLQTKINAIQIEEPDFDKQLMTALLDFLERDENTDGFKFRFDSATDVVSKKSEYALNEDVASTFTSSVLGFLKISYENKETEMGDLHHDYYLNFNDDVKELVGGVNRNILLVDRLLSYQQDFKDSDSPLFDSLKRTQDDINNGYGSSALSRVSASLMMALDEMGQDDMNLVSSLIESVQNESELLSDQIDQTKKDAKQFLLDRNNDIDKDDITLIGRIKEVDESGFSLRKYGMKYEVPIKDAHLTYRVGDLVKVKIDESLDVSVNVLEKRIVLSR